MLKGRGDLPCPQPKKRRTLDQMIEEDLIQGGLKRNGENWCLFCRRILQGACKLLEKKRVKLQQLVCLLCFSNFYSILFCVFLWLTEECLAISLLGGVETDLMLCLNSLFPNLVSLYFDFDFRFCYFLFGISNSTNPLLVRQAGKHNKCDIRRYTHHTSLIYPRLHRIGTVCTWFS